MNVLLTALVVSASLNGVGLGPDDVPYALPRQLAYVVIIVVAFLAGRSRTVRRPLVPVAVALALAVGATVVDDLGQGQTMVALSAATVGLPWLVGHALRQQRERVEQLEVTREAYAAAAAAAERQRIAADLHDDLGHDLALIALQAGALEGVGSAPSRAAAARVRELAVEATDRLRAVVGELGESAGAVSDVVRRAVAAGMSVELQGDARHPVLVRAAQEGLSNAARHAAGRPVLVRADDSSLIVTNPGPGAATGDGKGLGLLRDRVQEVGGEFHAGRDGDVWCLRVQL